MLLVVGVVVLTVAFLFVIPVTGSGNGGDDSSSFVPFIPIWFAAIIPILVAKREENTKHEKAKRRLKTNDRYGMMKDFVSQLNHDELQYLHRKLVETSGDTMAR
jgi:hypothetical protein